ncbi:MAG TPA: preprotein translocase subunit YajC [Thermodesulfobacteriota bacterium]|nr:preprotein translocase subunit YajC [Thermodesulfobacteriota bacterium]
MTTSGIYGKITGITETVVTLEIAPQVKIKIARDQIAAYSEPK